MSDDNFTPIDIDADINDIEDLPSFGVYPSGSYLVTLDKMEKKDVNNHPAVEASFKLDQVMEMTETGIEEKDVPQVGAITNTVFMLDNKIGAGKLKEFCAPLAEKLGVTKISSIMEQAAGLQILVVIKRTYDDKKDRHYANIKKVAVV